jgi:hypothetical protein
VLGLGRRPSDALVGEAHAEADWEAQKAVPSGNCLPRGLVRPDESR